MSRAVSSTELMEQCRRLLEDCERQESRPASKVTYDTTSKSEDGSRRQSQRQSRGGGGDESGMRVLVNALGEDYQEQDYREEYREDYREEYKEEEPQLRPRRSSFGSSSPKVSREQIHHMVDIHVALSLPFGISLSKILH